MSGGFGETFSYAERIEIFQISDIHITTPNFIKIIFYVVLDEDINFLFSFLPELILT